jgi:ParB-like chromosome segregation protein Spo0J
MLEKLTGPAMPPAFEYDFHPLAELFPLIEGQEFDVLVADVRQNGIIVPITRHEGKILDGRNRYRAAKAAGHALAARDFRDLAPGLDPKAFVISANIARRQLTSKQKREFIAKQIDAQPDASDRAIAKLCCVDPKTVGSVRDEMARAVETLAKKYKELTARQQQEFLAAINRG